MLESTDIINMYKMGSENQQNVELHSVQPYLIKLGKITRQGADTSLIAYPVSITGKVNEVREE